VSKRRQQFKVGGLNGLIVEQLGREHRNFADDLRFRALPGALYFIFVLDTIYSVQIYVRHCLATGHHKHFATGGYRSY
jgi:hypothetical protein